MILGSALAAQTLDVLTMAVMVDIRGPEAEWSPVVEALGFGPAVVLKLCLMVYLVWLARWTARRDLLVWPVLLVALVAGLFASWVNVLTVLG